MSWLSKNIGRIGTGIATGGLSELYGGISGATKSNYNADENAYNDAIGKSQANNLTLQQALVDQMNGGGPNLAQQQFQNSTQQLQQQAAGQIGAIKGISPAAQAAMLQRQQAGVGQNLAGEAAAQRMQQQLAAQQQLGQQSLGMFDVSTGRKLGAQQVNAGTAAGNAANQQKLIGGFLSGVGGAAATGGMSGGAPMASGGVVAPNGPESDIGRALMGMADGGEVFAGEVPGQAEVPGDSLANDTVPKTLSPGEIVIPRSHATPEGAASFVAALQRRNGGGYQHVVAARQACHGGRV